MLLIVNSLLKYLVLIVMDAFVSICLVTFICGSSGCFTGVGPGPSFITAFYKRHDNLE